MIVELVTCDGRDCDHTEEMTSGMVPHAWVSFNGRHYCGAVCFCRTHGGDE